MDIEISGQETGRIMIGLFGQNAPDATENFRLLSTCTQYSANEPKKKLCYKDTILHRIIPHFAIQGGDITHQNGIGGEAAIRMTSSVARSSSSTTTTPVGTYRPQMKNVTNFNRPYMLAVATPDTMLARSQFFITTVKAQWLTGKYTVFGMILEGTDTLSEIEKYGTYGGHPKVPVKIVNCGELPLQPKDKTPHY
jgi:peptidylprolyl isomerase